MIADGFIIVHGGAYVQSLNPEVNLGLTREKAIRFPTAKAAEAFRIYRQEMRRASGRYTSPAHVEAVETCYRIRTRGVGTLGYITSDGGITSGPEDARTFSSRASAERFLADYVAGRYSVEEVP